MKHLELTQDEQRTLREMGIYYPHPHPHPGRGCEPKGFHD